MLKIPKKVMDRWPATVKSLVAVAISHKTRDVSEADTVTLVKDMLAEVFGYDKYDELTSEQQIRGTFCDLAVKIDGKIRVLIEVKAAAIALNETHLRQAINYGAHEGIEWIVLTNALEWRLYRIKFGQPIEYELVSSFCIADINLKMKRTSDVCSFSVEKASPPMPWVSTTSTSLYSTSSLWRRSFWVSRSYQWCVVSCVACFLS